MRYAREHIGTMFSYSYKRAIATALFFFAFSLALGLFVTALLSGAIISGYVFALAVWFALGILTGVILVIALVNAHHKTSGLMTEKEYSVHSKHLNAWISGIIVGTLAFAMPLPFLGSGYMGPLFLMLTFAGVLVVLYLCFGLIFSHWFNELILCAVLLLIIFAIALFAFNSSMVRFGASQDYTLYWSYAYLITVISLIGIAGSTGIALFINSSRAMRRYSEQSIKHGGTGSEPTKRRRRARRK